jgi:hypothetical protein
MESKSKSKNLSSIAYYATQIKQFMETTAPLNLSDSERCMLFCNYWNNQQKYKAFNGNITAPQLETLQDLIRDGFISKIDIPIKEISSKTASRLIQHGLNRKKASEVGEYPKTD